MQVPLQHGTGEGASLDLGTHNYFDVRLCGEPRCAFVRLFYAATPPFQSSHSHLPHLRFFGSALLLGAGPALLLGAAVESVLDAVVSVALTSETSVHPDRDVVSDSTSSKTAMSPGSGATGAANVQPVSTEITLPPVDGSSCQLEDVDETSLKPSMS